MLNQKKVTIQSISIAIKSYKGFTKGEKLYALEKLESCNLEELSNNLSELSLDAKPFFKEAGLI